MHRKCWCLFFNKVADWGLKVCSFIKNRLQDRKEFCVIFKNIYIAEHLWATANMQKLTGPVIEKK